MGLPPSYQPKASAKKEYELLPDDTYEVEITKMEFKENQPVYQKDDEFEDRLSFEFTVVENTEFKGRKLWKDTRIIMSAGSTGYSPSWLYKLFCAVNRVNLTDEETKTVQVDSINEMLGKRVRLVVKKEPNRNGDVRNKIKDMLPLKVEAQTLLKEIKTLQHEEVPPIEDINVDDIPF